MTQIASHCEAKLHALRKTQDGIVVSFVLHPQEVPDALNLAPLGTRYMLAFSEIGDDEEPKPGAPAKQRWDELPLSQRAALLCNNKEFQFWLESTGRRNYDDESHYSFQAAEWVRKYCDVLSRGDIKPGTKAAALYLQIENDYNAASGRFPEAR